LPLEGEQSNNLQYLYSFSIAADKAGFPEDSARATQKLMAAGQESAEVHLLMGKAHLNRLEDDEARVEFEKAARINPRLPFVHYYLGVLAKKRQDLDQAKAEFLIDQGIEPDVAFNYEELANICAAEGKASAAEAYFQQAVHLEPRLGTSYFGLAKLYKREGRFREALSQADRASAIDKDSASLHYLRGQLLQALNRKPEAEKEFATSTRMRDKVRDDLEQKISGKRIREVGIGSEQ
jgi:tetratricopeptide (TPR) repeat protein